MFLILFDAYFASYFSLPFSQMFGIAPFPRLSRSNDFFLKFFKVHVSYTHVINIYHNIIFFNCFRSSLLCFSSTSFSFDFHFRDCSYCSSFSSPRHVSEPSQSIFRRTAIVNSLLKFRMPGHDGSERGRRRRRLL